MFFLLSFYGSKNKRFSIFFYLITVLPFVNFLTVFHTNFQYSVFYTFLIITGATYINKGKIDKHIVVVVLLMLPFLLRVPFGIISNSYVDIAKDVKPFFILLLIMLFWFGFKESIINSTFRFTNAIKHNFVIASLFFISMDLFDVHKFFSNDPYFEINVVRYTNFAPFFLSPLLLYILVNQVKVSKIHLLYIIAPILYSGNRTIILSLILVVSVYYFFNSTIAKKIQYFSIVLISILILFLVTNLAGESTALGRFKELLSVEGVSKSLNNRFGPYFVTMDNSSEIDYIKGKGVGTTFFIEWFTYRENIKDNNIYLDNLYLTLHAKYGLMSIILWFTFYYLLRSVATNNLYKYYFLFLLIIGITNSFFYQGSFFWLFFSLMLFSSLSKEELIRKIS